jgi:ABC-type multidrug transport system fused ATPase/permease subunit
VSLVVPAGRHIAIIGANGSGKSTLLATLARHVDPESGTYRLGGVDVRTLSLDEGRARLAVVDDEPHLFASTLRENLRLARPGASDDDIVAALGRAGLSTWYAELTQGLDTMVGSAGRGVSGGERARIALARAVLSQRPVFLLDEPVAHLDHATAMAVLRDLRDTSAGRTVVIVSHRPDGLDTVDEVHDIADLQGQVTARS